MIDGCFEIIFKEVQFKCYYRYEPGTSVVFFSIIVGGSNPDQYILKVDEAKITKGIVSAVINVVDPKRGIYAPPQLKA